MPESELAFRLPMSVPTPSLVELDLVA